MYNKKLINNILNMIFYYEPLQESVRGSPNFVFSLFSSSTKTGGVPAGYILQQ